MNTTYRVHGNGKIFGKYYTQYHAEQMQRALILNGVDAKILVIEFTKGNKCRAYDLVQCELNRMESVVR